MSVEAHGETRATIRCDVPGCGATRTTRLVPANYGDAVMQCCESAQRAGWRVNAREPSADACPRCVARASIDEWNALHGFAVRGVA